MFFGYGTALAYHFVFDVEQSKAIYNAAMLKVFTKIDEFNRKSVFKTWLHRIVINTTIDYQRSLKHLNFESEAVLVNQAQNDFTIEEELYVADILAVIQTIAPSYRTVFLLHVLEGHTFKEIAEMLKITEGGAKALYAKAKLKLQVLINNLY